MKSQIRDFAWLALAICLGFGWFIDRCIINADSQALSTRLKLVGEKSFGVGFDANLSDDENMLRWFKRGEEEFLASVLHSFEKDRQCAVSENRDLKSETKQVEAQE